MRTVVCESEARPTSPRAAAFRLCLALAAPAALPGCTDAPPLIESGRVGQLAIGDTLQAIETAYAADRRRAVDLRLEGASSPAVEVRPAGTERRDALVAELIERDGALRVHRIQVRDPLLETARGIGVGDSVGDLRAAHALGRVVSGEGNVGIRVDALAATFLLDRDAARVPWARASDASAVPDTVRIRRILLTCPSPDCTARAAGWEAVTDQGAAFEYPPDLGTAYIHAANWPPQLVLSDEPFSCTAAGAEAARAGRTEPATIDGRAYCVTRVTEGAAGSVYTQYAYAAPLNGRVAILTFSLRAVQCGNYDEPRRAECERERAAFSIDHIAGRIHRTIRLATAP